MEIIESVPPCMWHPLEGFFHLLICELPVKADSKPGIVLIKAGTSNNGVTHFIPGLCVPAEVLQPSQISYHVCVGYRESSDDE